MGFEYRYEEQGDEWVYITYAGAWDMEDVAEFVAEKYWNEGDQRDIDDFEFEVEVREFGKPETLQKFVVTGGYSTNFNAWNVADTE